MAINFRKRIQIIPGVRLNVSKSGISTSVGVPGASLTFNKDGVYANTSIYGRKKLYHNGATPESNEPVLQERPQESNLHEYNCGKFDALESQSLSSYRDTITLANNQRLLLSNDLRKQKSSILIAQIILVLLYIIYPFVKDKIPTQKTKIKELKDTAKEILQMIENSYFKIDVEFDDTLQDAYNKVTKTFSDLSNACKHWDVINFQSIDSVRERTNAGKAISRRNTRVHFDSLSFIKSNTKALRINNTNGPDMFLYPTFIVLVKSTSSFALVDYKDLKISYDTSIFQESESVPKDAEIQYYTWYKCNKNGSRDKRFKNNFQIPVVNYGELHMKSTSGVNKLFLFSNASNTREFVNAINKYSSLI